MKKCVFTVEREVPTWEEVYNSPWFFIEDYWYGGTLGFRVRKILEKEEPTLIKEGNRLIFKYYEDTAILTEEQWNKYIAGDIASATLVFQSSNGDTTHCKIDGISLDDKDIYKHWNNPFYNLL